MNVLDKGGRPTPGWGRTDAGTKMESVMKIQQKET